MYLKVVRRKSERVPKPEWGLGGARDGVFPSSKGVVGDLPQKIFDLWLPLCAFLISPPPREIFLFMIAS